MVPSAPMTIPANEVAHLRPPRANTSAQVTTASATPTNHHQSGRESNETDTMELAEPTTATPLPPGDNDRKPVPCRTRTEASTQATHSPGLRRPCLRNWRIQGSRGHPKGWEEELPGIANHGQCAGAHHRPGHRREVAFVHPEHKKSEQCDPHQDVHDAAEGEEGVEPRRLEEYCPREPGCNRAGPRTAPQAGRSDCAARTMRDISIRHNMRNPTGATARHSASASVGVPIAPDSHAPSA